MFITLLEYRKQAQLRKVSFVDLYYKTLKKDKRLYFDFSSYIFTRFSYWFAIVLVIYEYCIPRCPCSYCHILVSAIQRIIWTEIIQ